MLSNSNRHHVGWNHSTNMMAGGVPENLDPTGQSPPGGFRGPEFEVVKNVCITVSGLPQSQKSLCGGSPGPYRDLPGREVRVWNFNPAEWRTAI